MVMRWEMGVTAREPAIAAKSDHCRLMRVPETGNFVLFVSHARATAPIRLGGEGVGRGGSRRGWFARKEVIQ
jgi:hypothetical protein